MPREASREHTVRTNKHDGTGRITLSPYTRGMAIRLHCTECLGFEGNPKDCTSPACALYPFRKKTFMAYEKEAIEVTEHKPNTGE